MSLRDSWFGWWRGRAARPPSGEAAPASGGAVYEHVPEGELRASQQHRWLFDDGVLHWNQHRREKDFRASFPGLNFVKEAAKTRLWGRPLDLAGDERVVLAGIDLAYADLQGCTLARADLREARMTGANLRNANLSGALLHGADLRDCDLRGATLDGAQFARARLQHANFSGASVKNANFAFADLSHAVAGPGNFRDANLFGAVRNGTPPHAHAAPPTAPATPATPLGVASAGHA